MTQLLEKNDVNVEEVIDAAPLGGFQFRVIILCAFIAMLDGFDTQSIAFVAPVLIDQWSMDPKTFGVIFSAGLLGIMFGQLIFGPMADRYGRRKVIILCTFFFGICSLATVLANGWGSLLLLRFLTGMGLGGATPNIIALTSEFSPKRQRATLISVMFAGFPFGAAVGGFISSKLIPAYGWEAVFYLGGFTPLIALIVLWAYLPESVHFLVSSHAPQEKIRAIINKISPNRPADEHFGLAEKTIDGVSFVHLFTGDRLAKTLLLCIAYFMGLLMVYFLFSWLPLALKQSGESLNTAIIAAVFLSLGGMIGGIVLGQIGDRLNLYYTLALSYGLAVLCTASVGFVVSSQPLLMFIVFMAGFCVIGGQTAMHGITTSLYPSQVRGAALGTALGLGRIGSMVGPLVGGVLIAANWPLRDLFIAAALPALVISLAVLFLGRVVRRQALEKANG